MVNNTVGAVAYSWVFNDGGVSGDVSPEYTFPSIEQSEQLVILIATSDKGCRDTTSKIIVVNEELLYYVPNTFTPDGDDFNQVFKPVFTSGYTPTSYHLMIFNRWGELVFESYDPAIGWEGNYGKDGNLVQVGTYTWKIQFKLKADDRRKEIIGYVNVLK
jgi:gliding motility-associated-like protein